MEELENERIKSLIWNLNADTNKLQSEVLKLALETMKLKAEEAKLASEALKLRGEARWYPVAVAAGLIGAGAAAGVSIAKIFS